MKKVAILQSNYIPWKGYFDLINSVDEFVLYEDVQYTRRDWRNRNKIKTASGTRWLSIPVIVKGKFDQLIKDTKVAESTWAEEHYKTLLHEYSQAAFFAEYKNRLEALYQRAADLTFLSDINQLFINDICNFLGITTRIRLSSEFDLKEEKTEKLLSICLDCGADVYVSGPAAQNYLDVDKFKAHDLSVEWFQYGEYQEYRQLNPPFEHAVTALDLIFNMGPEAPNYMNSFEKQGIRKSIR